MAEGPNDSAGESQKPEGTSAKLPEINLPMVVAPKLGADEDEFAEETEEPEAVAAAAASASSTRFLVLAASVAFAAAFGSFVGSVSGSAFAHFLSPDEPTSGVASTSDAMRDTKLELAGLSALKMDLDTATRSTSGQFAKIADRLDRLDRQTGVTDTTGSIAAPPDAPGAPSVPQAGAPDAPKFTDRILPDWVVQDVRGGRALVENRYGGVFEVGAGSTLPGVGRVDTIKREDGQWLVVTARGTITSGR